MMKWRALQQERGYISHEETEADLMQNHLQFRCYRSARMVNGIGGCGCATAMAYRTRVRVGIRVSERVSE